MIQGFVFDIGDTVDPSSRLQKKVLQTLAEKYNLGNEFSRVYLKNDQQFHRPHLFHAAGDKTVLKQTLAQLKIDFDLDALLEEMQELFWRYDQAYFQENPEGQEWIATVHYLQQQNRLTAIISDNSLAAKEKYLHQWREMGLEFDCFLVSEEVGAEKPDPILFQTCQQILGLAPAELVYFGNNLDRDRAALDQGWEFVWVYGLMDGVNPSLFEGKKIDLVSRSALKKLKLI